MYLRPFSKCERCDTTRPFQIVANNTESTELEYFHCWENPKETLNPNVPEEATSAAKMVNVPKARNTYCAKCNKHGKFKVCMSSSSILDAGEKEWDPKQRERNGEGELNAGFNSRTLSIKDGRRGPDSQHYGLRTLRTPYVFLLIAFI